MDETELKTTLINEVLPSFNKILSDWGHGKTWYRYPSNSKSSFDEVLLQEHTFRMRKDGSEIKMRKGIIVNEINSRSARAWDIVANVGLPSYEALYAGNFEERNIVPAAPVYKTSPSGDHVNVLSRYTGLNLATTQYLLDCAVQKAHTHGYPVVEELLYVRNQIDQQVKNILQLLSRIPFTHGHTHNKNFTVEYGEPMQTNKLQGTPSINSFQYDDSIVTFDLKESIKRKWVPIVRLIDFDSCFTGATSRLQDTISKVRPSSDSVYRLIQSDIPYISEVGWLSLKYKECISDWDWQAKRKLYNIWRERPQQLRPSIEVMRDVLEVEDLE